MNYSQVCNGLLNKNKFVKNGLSVSQPCKNSERKLNMHPWRNWQTRMVQVHIFERKCRFNSCRVHHEKLDFIGLFSFFLRLNCWQTHNLGVKFLVFYYKFNSVKLCNYHNYKFIKVVRLPIILPLQYEIMLHTAFPVNLIMFYKFGFQINFYPQLFITLINFDFINQQP